MNFEEYEKKLLDNKAEQMVAIEFYREIVDHFDWQNNYQVHAGWSDGAPSLHVAIGDKNVEFMFGNGLLRIHCRRSIFVIKINDNCFEAIKEIIGVLDYVEDDQPAMSESQ